MRCQNCHKKINFGQQMKDWDKYFGDGAIMVKEFPIIIMLDCPNCEVQIGCVFIEPTEFEDVKMTKGAFKGKTIRMPKV